MMTNADVALSLARAGFATFPCSQDKKPLIPAWRENSTTDEGIIQEWWLRQPAALPAIDCGKSNLVVIDLDRHKDGPDGVEAFLKLCEKNNQPLDGLFIVSTMTNGQHVYFRQPNGKAFGNSRGKLPPGIDVRGDGGYVIGVGAETANGARYESGQPLAAIEVPLPKWIAEILRPVEAHLAAIPKTKNIGGEREQAYANAALAGISDQLAAAAPGARNDTLNKAAFRLGTMCVRGWINRSKIETVLAAAAAACGLPQDDGNRSVEKTIASGIKAGERSPHSDLDNRSPQASGKAQAKPLAPIFNAEGLKTMHFEPIKYVVPGYIVEGLTLFAGKPKIGKSWLLLHTAIAVARGGFTLGEVKCAEGDVLYCALEDNLRRLKSRLAKLLGDQPWPRRLDFQCEMPRLTEGGLDYIKSWIEDAEHPRLVIVDTLAMVRTPSARNLSQYEADYAAVKDLRTIASKYNVAVVLVHHLRKQDADDAFDVVSGTLGLTGAPDTILIIKRDTTGNIILYGRGRDLIEIEKAMVFNKETCTWRIAGDAHEIKLTNERTTVIEALREAGEAVGPNTIANATGMKAVNVRRLLSKLVRDGDVQKAGFGKYERKV
jgi:Bifunctional DNA primase/polymerase, N-terminal/AAA domain